MIKLQNNIIIKIILISIISILASCADAKNNYIYVVPHSIYEFSYEESETVELTERMIEFLDHLAVAMQNDKQFIAEISGHSDNTADGATNLKRAITRAENAASYLKKIGVDSERIKVFNKGTREPITHQNDEKSQALNRRLEIKMTH